MSNADLLADRLTAVLKALERIPRRFSGIHTPADFNASEDGIDRQDAICMILIAVGEEIKQIDRRTNGEFLQRYPAVDWAGVKGVRNALAHGYFDVDEEELFAICRDDIPQLMATIRTMIADVQNSQA